MTHAASGHTRVVKSGSSVTHAASGHTRVVKNVSNVTHAASGYTRIVKEQRPETLSILVNYSWNRQL